MRLSISVLGTEVFAVEFDTPAEADEWTDCGTTVSTPVGFVRSPLPDWDDPGGYHTLDPGDDE
jgi:hypothetical protein